MAAWLLKTEPGSYSWDDLLRDGTSEWDGVRNHAAAGHLRAMRVGDDVAIYHSGADRAVVGTATITRAAAPDPADAAWVSVAVTARAPLGRPVPLAALKAEPALGGLAMLRQSRLSVSPVSADEWTTILRLGTA